MTALEYWTRRRYTQESWTLRVPVTGITAAQVSNAVARIGPLTKEGAVSTVNGRAVVDFLVEKTDTLPARRHEVEVFIERVDGRAAVVSRGLLEIGERLTA